MGLLLEQEVRKEQLGKWRCVQKTSNHTFCSHIWKESPDFLGKHRQLLVLLGSGRQMNRDPLPKVPRPCLLSSVGITSMSSLLLET